MIQLIMILNLLNYFIYVAIIIFLLLEFLNVAYPKRKEIKEKIDKFLIPLTQKFKINVNIRYYLLIIIPIVISVIMSFLTSIAVSHEQNKYMNNVKQMQQQAQQQMQQQMQQFNK